MKFSGVENADAQLLHVVRLLSVSSIAKWLLKLSLGMKSENGMFNWNLGPFESHSFDEHEIPLCNVLYLQLYGMKKWK